MTLGIVLFSTVQSAWRRTTSEICQREREREREADRQTGKKRMNERMRKNSHNLDSE